MEIVGNADTGRGDVGSDNPRAEDIHCRPAGGAVGEAVTRSPKRAGDVAGDEEAASKETKDEDQEPLDLREGV